MLAKVSQPEVTKKEPKEAHQHTKIIKILNLTYVFNMITYKLKL